MLHSALTRFSADGTVFDEPQHFLYFFPLPQGQGSLTRGVIAESDLENGETKNLPVGRIVTFLRHAPVFALMDVSSYGFLGGHIHADRRALEYHGARVPKKTE